MSARPWKVRRAGTPVEELARREAIGATPGSNSASDTHGAQRLHSTVNQGPIRELQLRAQGLDGGQRPWTKCRKDGRVARRRRGWKKRHGWELGDATLGASQRAATASRSTMRGIGISRSRVESAQEDQRASRAPTTGKKIGTPRAGAPWLDAVGMERDSAGRVG